MDVNADVFLNQEDVPVIVLKEFEIDTYVKGHHVYKDTRSPEIDQSLDAQIKPNNSVDRYAVFRWKSRNVVGRHLKKGATGRFAKTIFFPERRYLFESKNYNIWMQMRFCDGRSLA